MAGEEYGDTKRTFPRILRIEDPGIGDGKETSGAGGANRLGTRERSERSAPSFQPGGRGLLRK